MNILRNTIIKPLLVLCSVVVIFMSCDDFVQADLPDSQLTAPAVFEDKATATSAMTNIYSKIRDYGILSGASNGLSHTLGIYTDELTYFGTGASATDFYTNSLTGSDTELKALWTTSYNQIYAANAIIHGVTHSKSLSSADRNLLKGEALFIRALLHFYLTNLYGNVPYIATTDYVANSKVTRMPVEAIYSFVKTDLNEAISLLPQDYLSSGRTRPNVYTAHALLARVNLYMGLWAEASNEATAVLNHTQRYAMTSIDATFKMGSSATIWQLSPALATYNTEEGSTFIFASGPPPRSALSSALLLSFETNDLRKSHWIKGVSDVATTWYYSFKYKKSRTDGTSDERSILFRLEEQYLIRAEARAQQGELTGAKEDLNRIRNRAGLGNTTAGNKEEILMAIIDERRHELFTELGHRFFDLKRTNGLSSALTPLKPGWDATDLLFPLPDSELLLNPNLKPQNPGY